MKETLKNVKIILIVFSIMICFSLYTKLIYVTDKNNFISASQKRAAVHMANLSRIDQHNLTHVEYANTQLPNQTIVALAKEMVDRDKNPVQDENHTKYVPPISSTRRKILLYTNMRSGSSFVGAFFLQNPDIFYLFEPFKLLEQATRIPNTDHLTLIAGSNDFKYHKLVVKEMSNYLLQMFECNFEPLIKDAEKLQTEAKERREIKAWHKKTFAKSKSEYNAYPPNLEKVRDVCLNSYKHVAAKVIRGELLEHIFPLLESGVKVIHMVRDPRGAVSSRIKGKRWTRTKSEQDVRLECQHNYQNMAFIRNALNDSYKSSILRTNYRFVRFDDIALHTEQMAHKIYQFLYIPMPEKVQRFLKADPNVDKWFLPKVSGMTSEGRRRQKSTGIINKWRKQLDRHMLQYIETQCSEVMKIMGYRLTSKEQSKYDMSIVTFVDELPEALPFALRPDRS